MVVLGGGSPARPQRAAELFRAGAAPIILVSGIEDTPGNVFVLETNGVPAAAIVREGKSRTTFENAQFSIPLLRQMGAKRVIIVTSWFHSRRALACFEHLAPDIRFYSRPVHADALGAMSPAAREAEKHLVRLEYSKLLGYWLRYGICPLLL